MGMIWKIPATLLMAGVVIWICVFVAVCVCSCRQRDESASDCIIVLGARVKESGEMSRALRTRCERALEGWQKGVSTQIIVCGGKGADEPCSEAAVMRDWMVVNGVPREWVHLESASVNTLQNLSNAKAIMAAKGWKTAAVVTSDYHLQRALWLARDLGMDVCGLPARPPVDFATALKSRVRESVSWILYGLNRLSGGRLRH